MLYDLSRFLYLTNVSLQPVCDLDTKGLHLPCRTTLLSQPTTVGLGQGACFHGVCFLSFFSAGVLLSWHCSKDRSVIVFQSGAAEQESWPKTCFSVILYLI